MTRFSCFALLAALAGADLAVKRFMQDNANFETDLSRERLVLTHNPRGYLKRVR